MKEPSSTRHTPRPFPWVRNGLFLLVALLTCALPFTVSAVLRAMRPPVDLDRTFGCVPVPGVEESGFFPQEVFQGKSFRWTDGFATLIIPIDKQDPPRALAIDFELQKPYRTLLQVFVNETKVFDRPVAPGRLLEIIDLQKIDLGREVTIDIHSDTFVPAEEIPGSRDARALGVNVKGIRLLGREGRPASR
jgi:hypothetical protein